jgi:hypothetical protein
LLLRICILLSVLFASVPAGAQSGGKQLPKGLRGFVPNRPDLVIIELRVTGGARLAGTRVTIPLTLVVKNEGRAAAGRFAISIYNAGVWLPPTFAGQPAGTLASGGLAAGAEQRFTGSVSMAAPMRSTAITLDAKADTLDGIEFADPRGAVIESREDNNTARSGSVNLPALPPPPRPAPPPVPTTSLPENWQFKARDLKVVRKTESSGDEPYLIVFGFRVKFGERGSARATWLGMLEELGDDVPSGRTLTVWDRMGTVNFNRVRRLTFEEITSGERPEVIGAIMVVMESDATPFSEIRRIANKLREEIERTLEETVAAGRIAALLDADEMNQMIADMKAKVTPTGLTALRIGLRSFTDPDNVIGFEMRYSIGINDAARERLFPGRSSIVNLQYLPFESANPMVFKAEGGEWHVLGAIRKQ